MKGIIILADGFEDSEAIVTIDILRRAGLDITTVSIKQELTVTSQSKIKVVADKTFSSIDHNDYNFLVIPGGQAVTKALNVNNLVAEMIHQFVASNKLIAAICAAPLLVGKHGYFFDEEYTCYPGIEKMISKGRYLDKKTVVVSNNFITAKAMEYSSQFALAIVEKVLNKEVRKKVEKAICGA